MSNVLATAASSLSLPLILPSLERVEISIKKAKQEYLTLRK